MNASKKPSNFYMTAKAGSSSPASEIRSDRAQDCRHLCEYRHAFVFLHAAEALHGDLGMLTRDDVLLAISSSGETEEFVELMESIKRLGVPCHHTHGQPGSTLAGTSDIVLDIGVKEEACSLNLAPTASTAAALAMGDALAISLLERRGFKEEDFAALHPGGRLGKKLRRVEALMHSGEDVPRVLPTAKMPDVIYEMSRKGLGLAAVTEPNGRSSESSRTAICAASC